MILEYFTINIDNSARNDICFNTFEIGEIFEQKISNCPVKNVDFFSLQGEAFARTVGVCGGHGWKLNLQKASAKR